MSDPLALNGSSETGRSEAARAAIARAARATDVDFQYLLAQARLESSLDPQARAGTSSAAGLYQFTDATWLRTLERHGASHGLDWANTVISGGRLADPALRSQIMGLRFDAATSAVMAAELARDNGADLAVALGREPDGSELYLAHFLGAEGATRFLTALASDPGQSAVALMPRAAAANPSIFYDDGAPRSVSAVMGVIRGRFDAAMAEGGSGGTVPAWTGGGGPPPKFHSAGVAQNRPQTRSMAETLRTTFGGGDTALPANVRAAYARLARFDL